LIQRNNRTEIIESFKRKQQYLTIVGFSMFFGWLLAVPFEGQILYSIISTKGIEFNHLYELSLSAHLIALIFSGYVLKSKMSAKITMLLSSIVCILGSTVFYLSFSILWNISLIAISFFAGMFVSSWALFLKSYSKDSERVKIVVDVLILSNLFMLIFDFMAVRISPYLSLFLSIAFLLGSLLLTMKLDTSYEATDRKTNYLRKEIRNPFIILCVFIFVITISSGFMYQVIIPAYAEFPLIVAFYWAVPYITALLVVRFFVNKIDLTHFLYFALAMKGISFLAFNYLSINISSYLFVNTFLMAALGIFDMFLWVALSSFIIRHEEPARIWGYGLSINVFGILFGGIIGNFLTSQAGRLNISIIALSSVFVLIAILPFLLDSFRKLEEIEIVEDRVYENTRSIDLNNLRSQYSLTDRELEVINLVVKGYTYKAIADDLSITENTVKFHSKNIYSKFDVNTKMKLIEKIEKKQPTHKG
jgi:DNA-binding CsgD family transcriptional regulator